MANTTIYPYGTGGSLPASIGIINDLTTGGADKALSAQMGKVLGVRETSTSGVVGPDMVRRGLALTLLGQLTYEQSFCVYDGKYYSTDGSHIAEQDSAFTSLRTASINLGHGNSLQLGANGKAWASGWDDQKMYKVDLATLAIDTTITLPTTGYTTAAVDEANGLMYIFQRASYPDTEAAYNFIVYDYVNNQTISTRVIESFAAMQSVDYYQGKILMLYGLGTVAAPSGMRIYNTAGDVLATYDLSIFASTEPEGIAYDRENKKLLVSLYNKNLYKVE